MASVVSETAMLTIFAAEADREGCLITGRATRMRQQEAPGLFGIDLMVDLKRGLTSQLAGSQDWVGNLTYHVCFCLHSTIQSIL